MKGKVIFLICAVVLVLSACQAEPETIVETVVHEVTVAVPQTVEVTREVEVEVEVTRQVEVIQEATVEVTRIVEVEVMVTPSPAPEPTATSTTSPAAAVPNPPAGPPPVTNVTASLLQASYDLRTQLYRFRDNGMSSADCNVIVESDDYFNSRPELDVSGSATDVQTAYNLYREALAIARDASLGISQGCRDAIANGTSFSITHLNYMDINGKASHAIRKLDSGIGILEPLVAE